MRKSYDSKFKSRVALEAMRGELTIAEIASKYQVHPNQVQCWKKRLQEGATEIFMNTSERKAENKKLYTEDEPDAEDWPHVGGVCFFYEERPWALGLNIEKPR